MEEENSLNDDINKLNNLVNQTKDNDLKWKKKILFGSLIGFGLLIILIIILIIVRAANNGSDGSDDRGNQERIGDIECIFQIEFDDVTTNILGPDFQKGNNNFDIYINKEKIKYAKTYTFPKSDYYNVLYRLYSNINLDYMFKDVEYVTSCILFSDKKANITSMKSTFENAINFNSITVNGFNIKNVTSLNRLFYNSSINSIVLNDFNTSKIEDMSYMFAYSTKESFDLSFFWYKKC